MSNMRPGGAPPCWGLQYVDGDRECDQCSYRSSCANAVLNRAIATPNRQYLPVHQNTPPAPTRPTLPPPVYQPAQPAYQPPAPMVPTYRPPVPIVPQQPAPAPVVQYQQYQQAAPVASIPDPFNPNPMVPMMRPGAPGPAYYFCQYPGETIMTRIAKNMTLRAGEAVAGEAMNFLRHWTWPPRG